MKKALLHSTQTAPWGFLQGKRARSQLSIKVHLNQYLIDSFYKYFNYKLTFVEIFKENLFSRFLIFIVSFLFPLLPISSGEITDSFTFPGGRLQRVDGVWEEIKADQSRLLHEGGRDKEWVLLIDRSKKFLYNLPSKGGQSYWTTESEKTKWKPWQIIKREISSSDASLLTFCLNPEEVKLMKFITQFRLSQNLKPISLSSSLTTIAKIHLKDLEENLPTPGCSYHSWSNRGQWLPCCHTNNLISMECSFLKPKELTDYKENGFELIYFEHEENISVSERSLKFWKQNPEFNDFLSNKNEWKNMNWKAMGIAVSKRFGIIWLGTEKDIKEMPNICN
jgi:hypothetical protein